MARPHGIRGEVAVEVRTDDPGERFAPGAVLSAARSPEGDPAAPLLTVRSTRLHAGRLLVSFADIGDRAGAEELQGLWLTVDADAIPVPADPDEFHDRQLLGLRVVTVSGEPVGVVGDVLHHGQDLLVVTPAGGSGEAKLVPFVKAIAVEVDLRAGRIVIDPPGGLLELSAKAGAPRPAGGRADAGPRGRGAR